MNARTMPDAPALDLALEDLRSGAPAWADLPLRAKIAMLEALPPRIADVAPRMAAAATEAKGIPSTSAWVAEEWTINIWVFVQAVNTQILVLKRVLAGHEPVNAGAVHTQTRRPSRRRCLPCHRIRPPAAQWLQGAGLD